MSELTPHHTVTVNGNEREIFMSFGLLRDLARTFPNPQDPAQVFVNQDHFDTALWLLLVERKPTGKIVSDEFDLDEQEIDPSAAITLMKWAMEHLMSFFLKKLAELPRLGEASQAQMEVLLSAYPGLKALASTSPSAGLTASSEASSDASTSGSPTATFEPT